jgi:hypothetical protein
LTRWKNYFPQLLNVHGDSNVRQTEIYTAEPLVPEPSAFDIEMSIEKFKGTNHQLFIGFQKKLLKPNVVKFALISINLLILFGIKRNCLISGRSQSLYLFIRRAIDCSNYRGISLLTTAYKILSNILLSRLTPHAEEITGDHQCGFRRNRSTTDLYFAFVEYLRKNGNTRRRCISCLLM